MNNNNLKKYLFLYTLIVHLININIRFNPFFNIILKLNYIIRH